MQIARQRQGPLILSVLQILSLFRQSGADVHDERNAPTWKGSPPCSPLAYFAGALHDSIQQEHGKTLA
jgi:hypothetical protein